MIPNEGSEVGRRKITGSTNIPFKEPIYLRVHYEWPWLRQYNVLTISEIGRQDNNIK